MMETGYIIDKKYEIVKEIGRGGTSIVYLARHRILGNDWAVKEVCKEDCLYYDILKQGLIRETNILKKLDHPNLPKIIDIIIKDDSLLIIMEYIEGKTLKQILDMEGVIPENQVICWGRQICDVLLYLHGRRPPVIYRDLKPSNIILNSEGKLILIDFGTAKEYRNEGQEDTVYLGTKGYAAPEQYGGIGKTDERTDIYCFGVTVYHLLTGRSPNQPPYKIYPIRRWNPDFSPGLESLIIKCTQENPDERYQSCFELKYALDFLEENTNTIYHQEKRKILLWGLLLCGMVICFIFSFACGRTIIQKREHMVEQYIKQAEKSLSEEYIQENYINALKISPSSEEIYESLLKHYVKVNDFKMEDAVYLMNILENSEMNDGKSVLEALREKNPDVYCEFCYGIGVGYFYYMDGAVGKKEAQGWFDDVCDTQANRFSEEKKRRASLYSTIAEYYGAFVVTGADSSGERETKDYGDFFSTICELNQISLNEDSPESEVAAAYYISKEVAVEIGNFAQYFLNTEDITMDRLLDEIDKISAEYHTDLEAKNGIRVDRISVLKHFKAEEEINQLENLVDDARKKVRLAAKKSEGESLMG
ncbi:MAG: serine/threonine protein kinase [Clostridiales bacterium]|nr:serine/threonine protein kinase [Clostridiales bacterium]